MHSAPRTHTLSLSHTHFHTRTGAHTNARTHAYANLNYINRLPDDDRVLSVDEVDDDGIP